eukprot:1356216-Prymnesium_polylepis.1
MWTRSMLAAIVKIIRPEPSAGRNAVPGVPSIHTCDQAACHGVIARAYQLEWDTRRTARFMRSRRMSMHNCGARDTYLAGCGAIVKDDRLEHKFMAPQDNTSRNAIDLRRHLHQRSRQLSVRGSVHFMYRRRRQRRREWWWRRWRWWRWGWQ